MLTSPLAVSYAMRSSSCSDRSTPSAPMLASPWLGEWPPERMVVRNQDQETTYTFDCGGCGCDLACGSIVSLDGVGGEAAVVRPRDESRRF
jgi:hypothetical protein